MRLAPLQLLDYHVLSLMLRANSDYDEDKEPDYGLDLLKIQSDQRLVDETNSRRWVIDLSITLDAPSGRNIPYSFAIEMMGFVSVAPAFPENSTAHAVKVNGPSMLFGAAREIIRATTGRGPYKAVLLPSASFFTPPPIANLATEKLPLPSPVTSKKRARLKE